MALFNADNSNGQVIIQQVQAALIQIRDAMAVADNLHDFASTVTLADLTAQPPNGPGLSAATAQAILSACADAWGHSQLYDTGTDPRNPPAGYVYGASQKIVIGPRMR